MGRTGILDKRPTMSEWPVRIWDIEEIKPWFIDSVHVWMKEPFETYQFVYAPKRQTNPESFTYMFGYGSDEIFFMREESQTPIEIKRSQVTSVSTERELLNAKIIISYKDQGDQKNLEFPYIPSVYYLYDPFLNWLLGLDQKFMPALVEREHPRPGKLYKESLAMFNYSLGAYRLGDKFTEYNYRFEKHRCKWMPWKKDLEEWLEVSMERGIFQLHTVRYLTECRYEIKNMGEL